MIDAKTWLAEVSKVLGGKVSFILHTEGETKLTRKGGGKDDSAVGVGSEVGKIDEAVAVARKVFKTKVEGA